MYNIVEEAKKFGKHDLERLGLFIEMPYMNGKGYVSPFMKPTIFKGRGIMGSGAKSKCATQQGYFDDEFRRLFIGEGIRRPAKRKDKETKKPDKLPGLPFLPGGCTKTHACPGDFFGTFGGVVEAFSRIARPKLPRKKEPRNFVTCPSKKGGCGYVGICLSQYPEHLKEPYKPKPKYKEYGKNLGNPIIVGHCTEPYFEQNPFHEETIGRVYVPPKPPKFDKIGDGKWLPTGPAKWQGGCHAGAFSPYPEYITNRDRNKEAKEKRDKLNKKKSKEAEKIILPQSTAKKTLYTFSILHHNTDLRVNVNNCKMYEPNYTKRMLASS